MTMTNFQLTFVLLLSLFCQTQTFAQSTELIKDLAPGAADSNPINFAELDEKVFFFANDKSAAGLELWRTDGTETGTEMLGDLNSSTDNAPNGGFSQPFSNLAQLGNELYFLSIENNTPGTTSDYERSLFKVGSTGNPTLVKATDIEFFSGTELVVFEGNLYWIQSQNEIWKSDGTAAGTAKFFETSDRDLERIVDLEIIGGELFFTRNYRDINNFFDSKTDIWKTDGTAANTRFVKRAVGDAPTDCGGYNVTMFDFNGALGYFLDGNSMCSYESWMFIEGYETFTYNHAPISGLEISDPILKDGKIYFLNNNFGNSGFETNLTVLDGSQTQTVKIFEGNGARHLRLLDNGNFILEAEGNLWTSDGTTAGTKEIRNFENNLAPKHFIKYANGYIFSASEQTYTNDFWFTDGTVGGTRLLTSFGASNQVSPNQIVDAVSLFGNTLYFDGENGFDGEEVYKIELDQIPPAPVCIDNLFTNPGFEDGMNGWQFNVNDVVVDSDANSGNSAARLLTGNHRIYQFVAAEPNKEYIVRGRAKTNDFVNTYIKFLTADWQPTGRGMSQRIYGNYSPFEQTFTAPSDAAWVEVSFWASPDDDVLLDDLCLSTTNAVTQPAELAILLIDCPQKYPQEGEQITVPFTVQNNGGTASDPSKVYLYRFLATRFGSPSNLGNIDVPALQPGESIQLNVSGIVPGLLPETYYSSNPVPLSVGDMFLSFEINQFPTNEASVDFYCKKFNTDLAVEIIPVTTEYDVSGDIVFDIKATNNGSEDAYNVATYFLDDIQLLLGFYQLDVIVDANDTELNVTGSGIQWEIPRLNAGASEEIRVTYRLGHPTQSNTGLPDDFLINAEISSGHNTNTNTANDSDSFLFKKNTTSTGDEDNLTLTVVGDASLSAWQNGIAYFEITNRGGRTVRDIKIDFDLDANVRLVGGNEFSATAGVTLDNFWTQNPTATIPSIEPGGLAHVQLNLFSLTSDEIKVYGEIAAASGNDPTSTPGNGTPPNPNEDDEAVLIINGGTTPVGTPDLQMGSFIMGASLAQGENVLSNFNFRNIGNGDIANPFSLKVYLSTDGTPSNDDLVVGNYDFTALPLIAGDNHVNQIVVAIPNDAPVGNYFLIYSLDADNVIAESNEINNLNFRSFEVTSGNASQPDLTISNLFLEETSVETGKVLNYNFDLANVGSENVPGNFVIRAYLSTDGDISSDDIQDGIVPTGNFDAGLSVTAVPGASTINLPEGDYYLLLKVDADDQIAESDETNNLVQSSIQFKVDNSTTPTTACDKSVGMGNLSCFEILPGSDNYKIAYDSSGYQISKTLATDLEVVSTSAPVQTRNQFKFKIDTTSFKKLNADGSLIFEKTLPQSLANKLGFFPTVIEFNTGYIFFAWTNAPGNSQYSTDILTAIRTDANFNILVEKQVGSGSGDPSANGIGSINVINSNSIAYIQRSGFSTSVGLKLVLADGDLNILDEFTLTSGVFSAGGTISKNACGRFTVTDFVGYSYCKSGGCYGGNERDVDFSSGEIEVENSSNFEHRTTVGIGFESWNWFTETSDGGTISAARTQNLPLAPGYQGQSNPLDERINFTKNDAAGNQVDQWSVVVPGAADVVRIFEENGKIFLVKKTGGELSISELDCFDSPTGDYDLEIFNVTVPLLSGSFVRNEFSVRNNGSTSSPASSYQIFLSTDDVLSSNDEMVFTSSLNLPSIAPGESLTQSLGAFIDDDLPKGQQIWVFISLDPQNLLAETNENNNIGFNSFFNPGTSGNGADLELTFPAFFVSPAQWSFFGVPLTITNSGTETATGIKVEFKKDDGVVYKGNDEFNSSQGSFEYYGNEIWEVGTLAPGESAVLTVNYFRLTANDLNIYAQVSAMDQADSDSSPGNGSCCVVNEDDEAILALGAPSGNSVGNRSSIIENLDSKEAFAILNAFPNPVFDQFNLEVFSNENQLSDLIVYDVLGKPVLRQAVDLTEGHNLISVDASDLPTGILTVTMSPNHPYLRQVRVLKMRD